MLRFGCLCLHTSRFEACFGSALYSSSEKPSDASITVVARDFNTVLRYDAKTVI